MGYYNGSLSLSGIACSANAGVWLLIITLMVLPIYVLALLMQAFKNRQLTIPKDVKRKNDKELSSIDEVSRYFDIDITETDTQYLVEVKRRSDGENMRNSLAWGNFGYYMEWYYGMDVGYENDKYTLEKDTYRKAEPDEKAPDINKVRSCIELFILEYRHLFRYSDWNETKRSTE